MYFVVHYIVLTQKQSVIAKSKKIKILYYYFTWQWMIKQYLIWPGPRCSTYIDISVDIVNLPVYYQ